MYLWKSNICSCKCKKQTSVSHSSTESEVISFDVGLRMHVVLVRDLWQLVMKALHFPKKIQASSNRSREDTNNRASRNPSRNEIQSTRSNTNAKTKIHSNQEVSVLSNVDFVARSVSRSPMLESGCIIQSGELRYANAASSSQVWHQNENTRLGIENSMAKVINVQASRNRLRKHKIKSQRSITTKNSSMVDIV